MKDGDVSAESKAAIDKYEVYAAQAMRERSRAFHALIRDEEEDTWKPSEGAHDAGVDEPTAEAAGGGAGAHEGRTPSFVEAVLFHGDATQKEVLQNKLYVSKLSDAWLPMRRVEEATDANGHLNVRTLMPKVRSASAICDCNAVHAGTGRECYNLTKKAFHSVGRPHWEQRTAEADGRRMSFLNAALDKGSDHVGCWRSVAHFIKSCRFVAMTVLWCCFYQSSLMDKSVVTVCEAFKWCQDFPCKYFTAVSHFSTCRRVPGAKRTVRSLVAHFPDNVCFFANRESLDE